MNFSVDRDQLIDVLVGIQGVAERRHTMPVLSHALLTVSGETLTVVSSDLEIVIRCLQPVTGGEEGSIALPARKLLDIAKVLPKDSLVKVDSKDGNYVEISAAGRISAWRAFPPRSSRDARKTEGKPVSVDGDLFGRLVESVVQFASSDETRYNLAGVLMEKAKGRCSGWSPPTATGWRWRKGRRERSRSCSPRGRSSFRRRGSWRSASSPGRAGIVELSASEKFLFASKAVTEVWVRLLDAEFPDYRQVIPKENPHKATVDRNAFAEVLRRVGVMSPDKVHSVKLSFSGSSWRSRRTARTRERRRTCSRPITKGLR